jgi:hypothetical protein
MNSKRLATISIKNLSAAVDRAVKVVAEKNKVQFASGLRIGPTISGKTVRGITEIAQAEQVAGALTRELSAGKDAAASGLAGAEPAVLIREGIILCGFIAPEAVTFEE